MSTNYAVQAASFSEAIHVGRLNSAGTAFTEKQERTDMVLAAVAMYTQKNFDGHVEVTFPGLDLTLEVKVRPMGEEGDEQTKSNRSS